MKVYRIVRNYIDPNFIMYNDFQSIYYDLGYMSFSTIINPWYANTLRSRIKEIGNFYFLFLEDALNFINFNIACSDTLKLLEFDFPEELVFSLIGVGEYGDGYNLGKYGYPCSEVYINKSSIQGEIVNSCDIPKEKVKEIVLNDLKNTLQIQIDCQYYSALLRDIKKLPIKSLNDIKTKEFNKLYNKCCEEILKDNRQVIKTPYITNKSCMLACNYNQSHNDKRNIVNNKILTKAGFEINRSAEWRKLKLEIARMIENDDIDEAKKYIKVLKNTNN